jgi:ABC-2 type transport system ATP-binding protein
MRQRLTLAGAMLGDPDVLLLDEPANGLDPEGIAWLRGYLRHLTAEGRTVLVSSHVLSEVQQTVDDVVILARGRLVHTGPLDSLSGEQGVVVRSPHRERAKAAMTAAGWRVDDATSHPGGVEGELVARGGDADQVGDALFAAGVPVHLLAPLQQDLETTFLHMVSEAERAVEAGR